MKKRYLLMNSLLCLCMLSGCGASKYVAKESVKVDAVMESTLGSFGEAETFEDEYDWEELDEESETLPPQLDVEEITPFSGKLMIDGLELKFGETTFGEVKSLGNYELDDDGYEEDDPVSYKFTKGDFCRELYVLFSDATDDGVLLDIEIPSAYDSSDYWFQLDGLKKCPTHEDIVTYFGEPSSFDLAGSYGNYHDYIYVFDDFIVRETIMSDSVNLRITPMYDKFSFCVDACNHSEDLDCVNLKFGTTTVSEFNSVSGLELLPDDGSSFMHTYSNDLDSPFFPDYSEEFNKMEVGFDEGILEYFKIYYTCSSFINYCHLPIYEFTSLPCGSTIHDARDYYENVLNLSLADDVWVDLSDTVTYYDKENHFYISVEYDLETEQITSILYKNK